VEAVADGATMPGATALEIGLIDSLGGREEARDVLTRITGKSAPEVVFCEYQRGFLPF